ncbi:MAG: TonB-dependent receptor [Polyangiaceae bacterium]
MVQLISTVCSRARSASSKTAVRANTEPSWQGKYKQGPALPLSGCPVVTPTPTTFVGGLNDGRFVPYAPENTASLTADVDHESGFGGQVSWSFIDKQYADEFNTVAPDISGRTGLIPSYNVLDAVARYSYKPWGLTSTLTVKNALDQVYMSSRLPNGIFTAGFRQINLGLRWEH